MLEHGELGQAKRGHCLCLFHLHYKTNHIVFVNANQYLCSETTVMGAKMNKGAPRNHLWGGKIKTVSVPYLSKTSYKLGTEEKMSD